MSQIKDLSGLTQILHQTKNELQVVIARVDSLTNLLLQLRALTVADATTSRHVQEMSVTVGQIEHLLDDLLASLRQFQSPSLAVGAGPVSHAPAPQTKRILVIDDERSVVELVERILRARGYQVDTVCDGHAAIKMAEAQSYDLIMADLKMPDLGGMDVYHHIEATNPAQARRVVFFSGDVVSPHTTAFLNRIGSPFLVKPFTIQELVSFVEQALA